MAGIMQPEDSTRLLAEGAALLRHVHAAEALATYEQALQLEPEQAQAWSGKSENVAAAQRAFSHRARMNGLAALGQWKADLEKKAA